MRQKLSDALNEIRASFITEAAHAKAKKKPYWLSVVAAILVIVLLLQLGKLPMTVHATAVSLVPDCRTVERPDRDDYKTWEAWRADLDIWEAQRDAKDASVAQAAVSLAPFFREGSQLILGDSDSRNLVWSPINAYIGLAMAAELTAGESRQQILNLFGVGDLEALRNQVSSIWSRSIRTTATRSAFWPTPCGWRKVWSTIRTPWTTWPTTTMPLFMKGIWAAKRSTKPSPPG